MGRLRWGVGPGEVTEMALQDRKQDMEFLEQRVRKTKTAHFPPAFFPLYNLAANSPVASHEGNAGLV